MEAYMLTYSADDSGPVKVTIPDRLPPLVSFELNVLPSINRWCGVCLSLPSLCKRVAASLKMLSLTSMTLNVTDLQYIGDHLPLLQVLQFRCVRLLSKVLLY